MSDFVWIIMANKATWLGNNGVAAKYIIPAHEMNSNEACLCGGLLWIVLRGQDDRCIGAIQVKKVECFAEGYYSGDYLLTCDFLRSARFSSNYISAKSYQILSTKGLGPGLHQISPEALEGICSSIQSSIHVKLVGPPDGILSELKLGVSSVRNAMCAIVQRFTLDQVWTTGWASRQSPFANFAQRLLILCGGADLNSQFISTITDSDPLHYILNRRHPGVPGDTKASSAYEVDLDFTEIDPKMIFARRFIQAEVGPINLENALAKTEAAEQMHQMMLRDISQYLKSESIIPCQSGSIDLMINQGGATRIYEIKSATEANLFAQAAKGAFQLGHYMSAMVTDYSQLSGALITQAIEDNQLQNTVTEALRILCIKHLIYYPKREWPSRVIGLLN